MVYAICTKEAAIRGEASRIITPDIAPVVRSFICVTVLVIKREDC